MVRNTSTALTFTLDGVPIDESYTSTASVGDESIAYDVQMFASGPLSYDTHTFTMTNGPESLAIFDYMTYE